MQHICMGQAYTKTLLAVFLKLKHWPSFLCSLAMPAERLPLVTHHSPPDTLCQEQKLRWESHLDFQLHALDAQLELLAQACAIPDVQSWLEAKDIGVFRSGHSLNLFGGHRALQFFVDHLTCPQAEPLGEADVLS